MQERKINIEFPSDTIEGIRRQLPALASRMDDQYELRRIVNNAIRVYMELKLIAKDKPFIVAESEGKRYTISLE